MKSLKLILAIAIVAMIAGCGPKKDKVLVLYYSQTGNTKAVAEEFAKQLKADIDEIEALYPYDGDFQATIERCIEEKELDSLPYIKPIKADLSKYNVIFIGYPVWFGTYAPPIATFLANNDLSGKKIVPFCTFGSGGLESSRKDIFDAQPDASIMSGYGVRAARMDKMKDEVKRFLIDGNYIRGKKVRVASFSYPHPVMEHEIAIFDAAVKGYPMLNAEPTEVAFRSNNGKLEYRFTAVDKPREDRATADSTDKPDLPPAGNIQVYVLIDKGVDTSFTEVVR